MIKVQTIFAVFFIIYSTLYVWHRLLDKRINYKSIRFYITLLSLMMIALINYFNVNQYIRITVVTISLMLFFKFLFKENIQKCIITPLLSQLTVMISELIFAMFLTFVMQLDSQDIVNTQFGQLLSNFAISIILIILNRIPLIKKLYVLLLDTAEKIKKNYLVVGSFLLILLANLLVGILYYKIKFQYLLLLNTLLTIFYFFIVFYAFKAKNDYLKISSKYNTTLNSLKEYEDILDKYRILNHENKNELLTIRNMIPKSNTKVLKHIDTIVENKLKDNDKLMLKVSKIPAGGLRGLIYSKVLLIENLNINYELKISSEIKTVDIINRIDDFTTLDICKIIGVYLDNAIQATEKISNKFIGIEMYLENDDLIISISNTYEGSIELEKIENKGYTKKGNGHGYGLFLTKQILEGNNKLSNEKRISKEIFTQVLKIKMK